VPSGPSVLSDPIRFGEDFEFDPRSQKLRRDGRVLKLERIPAEILLLLIENGGGLVAREQIIERIWGPGVFLDTDNSINGAIRKIRQVLKDDAEEPKFIQTVTGRGYRFIAPLVLSEPATRVETSSVGQPQTAIALPQSTANSWKYFLFAGLAVLLVAAAAAYFLSPRLRSRLRGAEQRSMLAVLPFENLTGDAGQEYFSDGLTEEMISQLGNLDPAHLGVIARTSVMHYKHTQEPLQQIGKELGVNYVIEGSVRRNSGTVRVTAQLIQVSDQSHMWAREYDRNLSDLLALQGEIAQEIADEIQLTLGDKHIEVHRETLTPQAYQAYDLYLRGRFFWSKRTVPGFQQAIDYFQQAIAKDPRDARSYAGLADSYALIGGYGVMPQTETMPKARAAALRALELNPELAEAHTSLALITENFDFDWETAEREYRRAIALNPNYATAHQWYAECLSFQGRFDEALAESERARQLDPLSLIIASDKGMILYYARRYDEAIEQFREVHELDPTFERAFMIVGAYVEKGQFAEALATLDKTAQPVPGAWELSWRTYVYARSGQRALAQESLAKLQQIYGRAHLGPDAMLWAHLGMGDRDESFTWLEKSFADHSNALTTLKVAPAFDFLRSDPRFQQLLRRAHLAP